MAAGNQNDNTTTSVLIIVGFLIIGVVLTNIFGNDIMAFFLQLRMWVIKGYLTVFHTQALQDAYDYIDIYTPKEISFGEFAQISGDLRFYLAIPFALFFIPFGYRIYKRNPLGKHTRIMGREELCASEVGLWPWIAPVLKLNIVDQPIDKGSWAMSDTVLIFCRKYSLLDNKNNLQEEKARKVFIDQLGSLWNGIDNLKSHEKAILACFLAQLNGNSKDCLAGLSKMSVSIAQGNIDYSFVDEYLKKYAYTETSEKALNCNAYTLNVIATVYEKSKKYGKLPPSFFLWLKVVDRRLYYTLQCVGRKLPFCEVAGIFGHGLAEKVVEEKCYIPYVDKAVAGLKEGLTLIKIVD